MSRTRGRSSRGARAAHPVGRHRHRLARDANLRALQRQLRQADYHVLHYIGHGGYDQDADDGVAALRGRAGPGPPGHRRPARHDPGGRGLAPAGGAQRLRRRSQLGAGPVLGRRDEPDRARDPRRHRYAVRDHRPRGDRLRVEFYAALADGYPVDSSVAEARKAIYADENDIEWATPVLFMRVPTACCSRSRRMRRSGWWTRRRRGKKRPRRRKPRSRRPAAS